MSRPVTANETATGQQSGRVPTVDGTRVELDDINLGEKTENQPQGGRLQRLRRTVSLFLAGMYTGIGCSGVPHSHHTYSDDRDKGPL